MHTHRMLRLIITGVGITAAAGMLWALGGGVHGVWIGIALVGIVLGGVDAEEERHRQTVPFFLENPMPMWIFDLETLRILTVNPAACKVYGYTYDEMMDLTIKDLRPKEQASMVEKYVQRPNASTSLLVEQGIWLHKTKDGREFFVKIFSHLVTYDGRKARFVMALDVDAQVQSEMASAQELALSAKRTAYLESLLENQTNLLLMRVSVDGIYTYVNKALAARIGLPQAAILGRKVEEVLPPDNLQEVKRLILECIDNPGEPISLQFVRTLPNGDRIISDWDYVAITNENGDVAEIQGMGLDVTEKVRYLKELTRYKGRLETILESITDGFFVLDLDWRFIYINTIAASLYNRSPEELIGKYIWNLMPAEREAELRPLLEKALSEGKGYHDLRHFPELDMWIEVDVYVTPEGIAINSKNVTEREAQKKQIAASEAQLKDIAWVQSHKVRAPLANILGLVQIFNRAQPADPFNVQVLDMLQDAARRLDEVIHEVVQKTHDGR